jgi:hypothetical protein
MFDPKKTIGTLVFALLLFTSLIVKATSPDSVADDPKVTIVIHQESDSIIRTDYQMPEHSSPPSIYVPKPSPVLLFSMGLLGVVCVVINERKKKTKGL